MDIQPTLCDVTRGTVGAYILRFQVSGKLDDDAENDVEGEGGPKWQV